MTGADAGVERNNAVFDAVAFAGEALAPFFLQDPVKGDAGAAFEAMAALDPAAAAAEWPFVGEDEARAALSLMEGALLIFLIVFLAPRLGVTWFADHAAGTHLLAWFLNNTPRSIIASLT